MEWRCEWCGKPHPEDDPPCDNCGHGQFERAVVPAGPEGDAEGGPLVWVCGNCGREHPRHNPPCSRCGGMEFDQRPQSEAGVDPNRDPDDGSGGWSLWGLLGGDDEDDDGPDAMTVWACSECGRTHQRNNPPCSRCGAMSFERERRVYDGTGTDWDGSADEGSGGRDDRDTTAETAGEAQPDSRTMTSWICTDCGRQHTRNNPPCSRCGGMEFERHEQRFDDAETATVGWLEVVDAKVVLGFAGALVMLALLVGPALGLFTLPGTGPPTVEDVPGEDEQVGGVALADVERSFVADLGERQAAGTDLAYDDGLSAMAAYTNRRVVKSVYADGNPPSREEIEDAFPGVEACSEQVAVDTFDAGGSVGGTPADSFDSADAMAAALVDAYLAENGGGSVQATDGFGAADVHVGPDGRVFVTVVVC